MVGACVQLAPFAHADAMVGTIVELTVVNDIVGALVETD